MNILAQINGYALLAGLLVSAFIIVSLRSKHLKVTFRNYVILLATFPVYYWWFSIYDGNVSALLREVAIGLLFIVIAWLAYRLKLPVSALVLSFGFVAHGVYDFLHFALFEMTVAPAWWPEFCGVIDILLGLYTLKILLTSKAKKLET